MLQMVMSSDGPQSNEVLEGESVKGPLGTPATLDSVVDLFSCWIGPLWIIMRGIGVILVEDGFILLKVLHLGVVDILGKRDESG